MSFVGAASQCGPFGQRCDAAAGKTSDSLAMLVLRTFVSCHGSTFDRRKAISGSAESVIGGGSEI